MKKNWKFVKMFKIDIKKTMIFFTVLYSIVFLIKLNSVVWWDEAIYIGMGKYLFSLGKSGLYEVFRPPIVPLINGFLWFLGFSKIYFFRLLTMLFSLGVVYSTYLVCKKITDEKTSLIASFLIGLTQVFVFFSSKSLSGIPSTFFALIALYMFFNKKYVFSGLLAGTSFLTRFPQGLIFGVLFLVLIYDYVKTKKHQDLIKFVSGFSLITLPYLVLNQIYLGNALTPFIKAQSVIMKNLEYYGSGIFYYFKNLFVNNPLFLFALPGIYFMDNKRNSNILLLLLVSFFAYFLYLPHKEIRFAIVFLPYLAIITAIGLRNIFKDKIIVFLIALLIIATPFVGFFTANVDSESDEYYDFVSELNVSEYILSISPVEILYTDEKVYLLNPWYEYDNISNLYQIKPDYICLNSYYMACPIGDTECEQEKENAIEYFKDNYKIVYSKEYNGKGLYVFS